MMTRYIAKSLLDKGLGGEAYEYFCELKFDGVSISMSYENGLLIRGVTRGDGVRGDDETANVRTIRSIPFRAPAEEVQIRGTQAIAELL